MSDDEQVTEDGDGSQGAKKRKLSNPDNEGTNSTSDSAPVVETRVPEPPTVSWEEQSLFNLNKDELITLVILRGKEIKRLKEESELLRELNFQLQKGLPSLSRDLLRTAEILKESHPSVYLKGSSSAESHDGRSNDYGSLLSNYLPRQSSHVSAMYGANPGHEVLRDLLSPANDVRKNNDVNQGSSLHKRGALSPGMICTTAAGNNPRVPVHGGTVEQLAAMAQLSQASVACDRYLAAVNSALVNGYGGQTCASYSTSPTLQQMRPPMVPPLSHFSLAGPKMPTSVHSVGKSINDIANALRVPLMGSPDSQPSPSTSLKCSNTQEVSSVGSNNASNNSSCFSPPDLAPDDQTLAEDDEMVELSPSVSISRRQLDYCNTAWTYTRLVRQLMIALFDRQTLASSSVMGRRPTVLKDADAKPALDALKRDAIINYVQMRFPHVDATQVKQAMAQKCRELHDQYRHALRGMGHRPHDNHAPDYSGVSLLQMKHENESSQCAQYNDVTEF